MCVCVCVCTCTRVKTHCNYTYSVQQAAGLVQLAAVGRQLGLHAVLLTQQVGDQDAHQAAADGARQHLALHLDTHTVDTYIANTVRARTQTHRHIDTHTQSAVGRYVWCYLVEEAGEEGVGSRVVEEGPLVHEYALDVFPEGWVLTQLLHTGLGQGRLHTRTSREHRAP